MCLPLCVCQKTRISTTKSNKLAEQHDALIKELHHLPAAVLFRCAFSVMREGNRVRAVNITDEGNALCKPFGSFHNILVLSHRTDCKGKKKIYQPLKRRLFNRYTCIYYVCFGNSASSFGFR